jgi:hypothetical protein
LGWKKYPRFDNGSDCFDCFSGKSVGFSLVFKKITNPSLKTNPQLTNSWGFIFTSKKLKNSLFL